MQVFQGLSGLIVVEGLLDPFTGSLGSSTTAASIPEVFLALKDLQIDNSSSSAVPSTLIDLSMPTIRTVNGIVNPTISVQPNQVQLWRVANIGANLFYELSFSSSSSMVAWWEIARDGSRRNQLIARQNSSLLLGPSNRVEFLLVGPAAGVYNLETKEIRSGEHGPVYPQTVLATVNSSGILLLIDIFFIPTKIQVPLCRLLHFPSPRNFPF